MAPKKTTANSMVKPPDILIPEKTTREPKPRKRVAAPRVPRVKKPKARLKPVHIVMVKIPAPKGKRTPEPDINDEPVQEIKEVTPFTTTTKPKTKSPKPPSYPRKLKKEDALKIANEVALAQLVKKSIKPPVTKAKTVKKINRKPKQKLVPSAGCSTEHAHDVSIATTVKGDKEQLSVEPKVKAPKAAMKINRKRKPKLQAPTQKTTEAPIDISSLTFTEAGNDEQAVETIVSPTKAVKERKRKSTTKVPKQLETADSILNGKTPKVFGKRVYKKKGDKPKWVSEDIGENNTTLEAESMDTSGALIEESRTISVKKRRGRARAVRKNPALNKTDGVKGPKPTNLNEAEPADSVETAKELSKALITKTDDNKKDVLAKSQTTSVSDTFSWARDISSSSAATSLSSRSLECLNGKQLTVKVVDNVYKMLESLQLKRKLLRLPASSDKNNAISNVATKNNAISNAAKNNAISNVAVKKSLKRSAPPENSADAQTSPRKSTRLNNKLTNSPLEKTEEPKPKKILKLSRSFKPEVSNFSENTKSGSRTSMSSDITSETNKHTRMYSESSSSKVTSSMSIPMSAISEITRAEEPKIEECFRVLADMLNRIDLTFLISREQSLKNQNIIEKLSQIPPNNFKFEMNHLSKWKNRQWTFLPNEAQSEKNSVKYYSCTKSMDCTTSAPKENNTMEDYSNSPSAVENHMNPPNAIENHTNLFNSVDDRENSSNAEEDNVNLPNAVEDYINSSNAIEHEFENNVPVENLPNSVEDKFEHNKELDSFSDIVRQQSYERRSNIDDDDDLISLFADSIISAIEPSKGHTATVVSPFDRENKPKQTKEPFTIPKLSKCSEEAPQIDNQAREKIVIKNKTKIICEKQNADSTSINKEEQNKMKNIMPSPIDPKMKPNQSSPIRFSPSKPRLFNGVCFSYLIGTCKRFISCKHIHRKLSTQEIQTKLASMSDDEIKIEYSFLEPYPNLRRLYMLAFAYVCSSRKFDFILQIAFDSIKEGMHVKTKILDITLLHLNENPLDVELLSEYGVCLCNALMRALGETLNFSRFKKLFVVLIEFMLRQNRKFDLDAAIQLLDRNIYLPSEENVLRALTQMIKNTDPSIFEHSVMPKFEEMLYNRNRTLYEEITQQKLNILKLAQMPREYSETEFCDDNFGTENVIQENNDGIQSMIGQAYIEKRRYTSPDTTHLDNMQNKTVTEPQAMTGIGNVNNRTRTFIQPAPSSSLPQNFNNHSTVTPPSDSPFKRPNYKRNYNEAWRRGNARMPRIQPNIVRPMYRPQLQPPFRKRGGHHGYQRHPRNPWQYY